jgi:hypothetical protein
MVDHSPFEERKVEDRAREDKQNAQNWDARFRDLENNNRRIGGSSQAGTSSGGGGGFVPEFGEGNALTVLMAWVGAILIGGGVGVVIRQSAEMLPSLIGGIISGLIALKILLSEAVQGLFDLVVKLVFWVLLLGVLALIVYAIVRS